MSILLAAWLAAVQSPDPKMLSQLEGLPADALSREVLGGVPRYPRPVRELFADVREVLKQTAGKVEGREVAWGLALMPLYIELKTHPEIADVPRRERLAAVHQRMIKVRDAARAQIKKDAQVKQAAQIKPGALAQQRGQPRQGARRGGNPPANNAPGGRAVRDRGPELVELIQTVVSPATWDVNGGPGTIYYWSAWHILVVRNSSEVHENMADVAGKLRGN